MYSYTGKSGRHRITRQPEERIRPNRTAEIPKTDSTCKGENEDASKKEFARAAAVLIYGDWKVTKEATETEEGSRERGCAVCEYVQTEAIPAAGTGSPQTGDSSDMALWISLMLASCGGVLGMLFYRRKKAAAGK